MKRWWARISCLMLALLLVVTALPVFAEEGDEGAQEDPPKDFVILLDCSMSMGDNDTKTLCLQACWNFLDTLPVYDTRVSIIALG